MGGFAVKNDNQSYFYFSYVIVTFKSFMGLDDFSKLITMKSKHLEANFLLLKSCQTDNINNNFLTMFCEERTERKRKLVKLQ